MPFTSKKLYKMMCREKTLNGQTSQATGGWGTGGCPASVERNVKEGYKPDNRNRGKKHGKVAWHTRTSDHRTRDWPVLPPELRSEIKGSKSKK